MGSYLKYSRKRISRHALRNLLWTRQTLSLTVQSLNLPVVSKLLERIVVKQLLTHLDMHQLLPRLQSAYRSKHSTETALVKVISDILLATDAGDLAALVLLDLSTAFDTVDHGILLRRLETFGLNGIPLRWFKSYLVGRRQHVRTTASSSAPTVIVCGVPQGSVLGHILFLLYIADLQSLIEHYDLRPQHFADDTQIYGFCSPLASSCAALQSRISECIDAVSSWMKSNRLQLSTAKTEIIWLATGRRVYVRCQRNLSASALIKSHQLLWFVILGSTSTVIC